MLKLTLLWTLCLPLLPILLIQAFWTKRRAQRLPEARLKSQIKHQATHLPQGRNLSRAPHLPEAHHLPESHHLPEALPPLNLLGLGDSVIAGVGIEFLEDAMTAKIAAALSGALERPVTWQAHGVNGDKIEDLLQKLPSSDEVNLEGVDLVVISIGVNDVTALTSITRWHLSVVNLIAELKTRYQAPILLLALPPMGRFPALPQPLRAVLGIRAAMLDQALFQAGRLIKDVYRIDPGQVFETDLMAEDGYHPSSKACELLAAELIEQLRDGPLFSHLLK